jgi:hypothetical protein
MDKISGDEDAAANPYGSMFIPDFDFILTLLSRLALFDVMDLMAPIPERGSSMRSSSTYNKVVEMRDRGGRRLTNGRMDGRMLLIERRIAKMRSYQKTIPGEVSDYQYNKWLKGQESPN